MRKDLLIIALGLSLAAGTAAADVLSMPEGEAPPAVTLPSKGTTMAAVTKRYGEPRNKRPSVGGDTPKHPPITRWDYDAFSVIFEHDKVVDAVIPGAPPRLYNKDQLRPATAMAAPALPASEAPAEAPPADAAPIVPETDPAMPATEAPAEAAAAPSPPPAEPANVAPASSYPDAPAPPAQTPAEEVPADAPPTPK